MDFSKPFYRLALLGTFAVAMAYLEAAVVVYLRDLYYPDGFFLPLVRISPTHAAIEIAREAATIIMLAVVAVIAGSTRGQRCGNFLILFGVWDIFYYFWLNVALGWPSSLLDWDILFLIPIPWIGPVIAPILISIFLIFAGGVITRYQHRDQPFRPPLLSWVLALTGTIVILYSFMHDTDATLGFQPPQPYHYGLLVVALLLYQAALLLAIRKSRSPASPKESR